MFYDLDKGAHFFGGDIVSNVVESTSRAGADPGFLVGGASGRPPWICHCSSFYFEVVRESTIKASFTAFTSKALV